MSELVTLDSFTATAVRRYVESDIPGFGRVRIQSLTAKEMANIEAGSLKKDGSADIEALKTSKARLIIACVVNSDGQRIMSDHHVETVNAMDGSVVNAIHEACEVHVYRESIEGVAKNSSQTEGDDSQSV